MVANASECERRTSGPDAKGKREKIIEGTIEDALKLQATMREEIHQSDHVAKQPPRLRDYVESWLKSKTLRVKTSTAMVYADTLAHYVLPHFGDWFIGKIGDGDVREWQAQLAKGPGWRHRERSAGHVANGDGGCRGGR